MTPTLTVFLHLRATPAWLALSRTDRAAFIDGTVRPLFARHPPRASRLFDAEAFSARCSDILMIETDDLAAYGFLIDALRDTAFFGQPYFEVVEVIPALEDGHVAYDRQNTDELVRKADIGRL